jgi:hypothetical protein
VKFLWMLLGVVAVFLLLLIVLGWFTLIELFVAISDLQEEELGVREANLVRPAGIEPATPSLEGSCSIPLSYGRGASDSTPRRGYVLDIADADGACRRLACSKCLVPLHRDDVGKSWCVNSDCPDYLRPVNTSSVMEASDAQKR